MLEDTLTDRDLVNRQTDSTTAKHLALEVTGLGYEGSMLRLMNLSRLAEWLRDVALPHRRSHGCYGSRVFLSYVLQGLFYLDREVRRQDRQQC